MTDKKMNPPPSHLMHLLPDPKTASKMMKQDHKFITLHQNVRKKLDLRRTKDKLRLIKYENDLIDLFLRLLVAQREKATKTIKVLVEKYVPMFHSDYRMFRYKVFKGSRRFFGIGLEFYKRMGQQPYTVITLDC